MFVFTAKLNKKKIAAILLAVLLLVLLVLGAAALFRRSRAAAQTIRGPEDAAAYLAALGWQVDPLPLEVQDIVIPRDFSQVYETYLSLQREQGFPLEKYGGMPAVRYTFRVCNYPGGVPNVVADLIVYETSVIAGDIQCTALDGFMEGLRDNAPAARPQQGA